MAAGQLRAFGSVRALLPVRVAGAREGQGLLAGEVVAPADDLSVAEGEDAVDLAHRVQIARCPVEPGSAQAHDDVLPSVDGLDGLHHERRGRKPVPMMPMACSLERAANSIVGNIVANGAGCFLQIGSARAKTRVMAELNGDASVDALLTLSDGTRGY
jgi:hypothetical protein